MKLKVEGCKVSEARSPRVFNAKYEIWIFFSRPQGVHESYQ